MKLPEGFRRAPPPDLGCDGDDVDEEIRFHIDSRTEELVARGLDPTEARRQAREEFGDRARAARLARKETGGRGRMVMRMMQWVGETMRDLRLAARQLRRNPGLAGAALVTLALGVGGTTAMYSVVHGVLFVSLPYPDEERVVRIWPVAPGDLEGGRQSWSVPDLDDWRARARSLTAIGGYSESLGGLVVLDDAGAPEEVATAYVTAGFFEALGTRPVVGRPLPDEVEPTDPRVVVLSEGYWERRFGRDPSVVGRALDTQTGPYRIVGVMPGGYSFPNPETELWTFLATVEQSSVPWLMRQVRVFDAVARVTTGTGDPEADLAAAEADLAGVARSLADDLPDTNAGITSVEMTTIREALVGDVRTPLLLVAGAVALTLLIACANVANLLLARSTVRRREFALRASLGAGRGRLVRQVLAESLFLGLVGGAAGALLATLAVPALVAVADGLIPRAASITVDGSMLLVILGISIGTGLVVGLLPALGAGRASQGLGRGVVMARGVEARGMLDGLVLAEVGLAVVLLVGGGLLMRSLAELRSVDPGFDPEGILVADMVVSGYEDAEGYIGFRDRLLERLEGLPGVLGASTAKEFPTRGMGERWPWALPGDAPALPGEERMAQALHVHRDFFEVMRIPLVRGTLPGDVFDVSLVINGRLAREAFGSVDAAVGSALVVTGVSIPVRAVVGDVLHADPSAEPPPMIYVDDRLNTRRVFSFIVRADGDPVTLVEPFRQAVADEDARQPVRSIYTARRAYDEAVGQPMFFAMLMTLFAAGAAVLAAVGIYGVVAYSVQRRTHEIGVRVALGADRGQVRRLVMAGALRPVLSGLLLGLVAAAGLSSLMRGMLFGVPGVDPLTYGAVAFVFLTVAVLASWGPAREATRIDPREALRAE